MGNWTDPVWGLHPELITALDLLAVAGATKAITFKVNSGCRSFERQALLWSTYRRSPLEARQKYGVVSRPAPMGVTRHHPFYNGKAVACDLTPDAATPEVKAMSLRTLGRLSGACGLLWGGVWPDPDEVHFELLTVGGRPVDPVAALLTLAKRLDELAAAD